MSLEIKRRRFLYYLSLMGLGIVVFPVYRRIKPLFIQTGQPGGANPESHVYVSKNGTPQQNVFKVIEMMGGLEKFIGVNDIVILKPNAQWWNQGRTNLAAMKGFIDLVLDMPGFKGEIIVAENHHFMDDSLPEDEKDNVRGWTHLSEINGDIDGKDYNLNTLIESYNRQGHKNITKYHWRDGGPKPVGVWGNGRNGGLVKGPADGDGYVWSDIDYQFSPLFGVKKWKVKMTYPIFTSKYSGITIDLKHGVFKRDGKGGGYYLHDRPVKLINFSVLNTHGEDTGITGSLKNYMGITDLSCGASGLKPVGYYNVHTCGGSLFEYAKAGPIAHFIKTIRKADLNIVTAEWVGWGNRIDVTKATRTKTVIAGTDPIALDYYGAKHVIYPLSGNSKYHNPDNPGSAVRKFLELASSEMGNSYIDEKNIVIHLHDFAGQNKI